MPSQSLPTCIFFAAVTLGALASSPDLDVKWAEFKNRFGKAYKAPAEESVHREVWETNYKMIQKHNQEATNGHHSYTLEENRLTDLNHTQVRLMAGARPEMAVLNDTGRMSERELADLMRQTAPDSVDYRRSSCMNAVRNQGSCGSCWAFAATAAVEFNLCKKLGYQVQLSEQQLVDCSSSYGNNGCHGGWYQNAWQYVEDAPGQSVRYYYPYSGAVYSCRYRSSTSGGTVQSWANLPSGDESAMANALASKGPLAVALHASLSTFTYYSGGIYSDPNCPTDADHAVVVVGYGSLNGQDYWIVRNSWGANWGVNGYIFVLRGVNQCGIAGYAAYPVV